MHAHVSKYARIMCLGVSMRLRTFICSEEGIEARGRTQWTRKVQQGFKEKTDTNSIRKTSSEGALKMKQYVSTEFTSTSNIPLF